MRDNKIPYVKPARFGNFKLWRSRSATGVEVINVSDVEGSWQVKIPSTFEMFAIISALYQDYSSDFPERRKKGEEALGRILSNMMYVTVVGNGYFHAAIMLVSACYAFPSYLEPGSAGFNAIKGRCQQLINDFLAWREKYGDTMQNQSGRSDEIAEMAQKILKSDE